MTKMNDGKFCLRILLIVGGYTDSDVFHRECESIIEGRIFYGFVGVVEVLR